MRQPRARGMLAPVATALAVAGCLLAVPTVASAAPRHTKVTTLKLVYDWPGMDFEAVPIIAGDAQGYYKKVGLNVQIVIPPTTSTTVKMLAVGKGTIGFDTTTDVVFAQAAGIDVKSIANYSQDNDWGLVSAPGTSINLKSLKGKSIGIFTDSWTKAMMPYVLKAGGVSSGQVSEPIFTTNDIAPMLAGKIDIATNTLNYAEAEVQSSTGKSPTVLLATKFGAPNVPIWVYTATSSWLSSHGSEARAFLSATKKAFAWSIAHPKSATDKFLHAYPKLGATKKYELDGWLDTIPALGKAGSLLVQRASEWTQVSRALKSVGLLTKVLPAKTYFTNAYFHG
jgi:ABC-type nitrate/sulfonate/bicarbonate transport system substrate-binding protein